MESYIFDDYNLTLSEGNVKSLEQYCLSAPLNLKGKIFILMLSLNYMILVIVFFSNIAIMELTKFTI